MEVEDRDSVATRELVIAPFVLESLAGEWLWLCVGFADDKIASCLACRFLFLSILVLFKKK